MLEENGKTMTDASDDTNEVQVSPKNLTNHDINDIYVDIDVGSLPNSDNHEETDTNYIQEIGKLPIYKDADAFIREYTDKLEKEIYKQSRVVAKKEKHEIVVIQDVRMAINNIYDKRARKGNLWSDILKTMGGIALGIGVQGVISEISPQQGVTIRGPWIFGYFVTTIVGLVLYFVGYIIEVSGK